MSKTLGLFTAAAALAVFSSAAMAAPSPACSGWNSMPSHATLSSTTHQQIAERTALAAAQGSHFVQSPYGYSRMDRAPGD